MIKLILFVLLVMVITVLNGNIIKGIDIDRLSLFSDWIDESIANNKFSGASYAVYRKKTLIHESFHGFQDLEKTKPISSDTIFRILSMTKPVIAVGLMMLYEKGKFKLNDPLSKYIPSFSKQNMVIFDYENNEHIDLSTNITNWFLNISTIPASNDIKIYHLLTHTAGLSYGFDQNGFKQPVDLIYNMYGINEFHPQFMSLKEFVDKLATLPLISEPGQYFEYSFASQIVGRLIEILSNQSLDEYLYENIFEPLNMYSTTFKFDDIDRNDVSKFYLDPTDPTWIDLVGSFLNEGNEQNQQDIPPLIDVSFLLDFQYETDYPFINGGAGLLSTLNDYLSFTKMLLNGGKLPGYNEKRLLSPKTVEFIRRNHLRSNNDIHSMLHPSSQLPDGFNPDGWGWGLGFHVLINNRVSDGYGELMSQGTYRWPGGAQTTFLIDPDQDLCAVFMVQLFGTYIHDPLPIWIYSAIIN